MTKDNEKFAQKRLLLDQLIRNTDSDARIVDQLTDAQIDQFVDALKQTSPTQSKRVELLYGLITYESGDKVRQRRRRFFMPFGLGLAAIAVISYAAALAVDLDHLFHHDDGGMVGFVAELAHTLEDAGAFPPGYVGVDLADWTPDQSWQVCAAMEPPHLRR